MAIHSLKDVPSMIPDGLTLGCIPDREIPFDAYIAKIIYHYKNCLRAALVQVLYVVALKFYQNTHI